MTEAELNRRLERLGALAPTPEAPGRAVERVRRALAETVPAERPKLWVGASVSWAAVAALLVVGIGLAVWLLPPLSPGLAWADVQAAVKAAHSVTFRITAQEPGEPDRHGFITLFDTGLGRVENEDGSYAVSDKSRLLRVNPKNRTAELIQATAMASEVNRYEFIRNLPGDVTARPLPEKTIDGRAVLGFAVKVKGQDGVVWADARTRLPVRIEIEDKKDGRKKQIVLDEIAFDKELDPKLFSFDVPQGYNRPSPAK